MHPELSQRSPIVRSGCRFRRVGGKPGKSRLRDGRERFNETFRISRFISAKRPIRISEVELRFHAEF